MASRINTEGNTYEANWKRTDDGYVAWLKRRPRQRVEGTTEEELLEQLWEIAMDAYGDGEACIDLVPSLPVAAASICYFDPSWFSLSCNEGFHRVGDSAALYRNGLCPFCRAGLGGRNKVERVINGQLKGDLGFVWSAIPSAAIVSDAFLKILRPLLGNSLRAHTCRSQRVSKKRMWELELDGAIPYVCHKKGSHNTGVTCPKCETARFSGFVYEPIQKGLANAVSRTAMSGISSQAFVAFGGHRTNIIVSEKLAKRLKKSLKGILLERLAMLAPDEIGKFKIRKLKRSDVSG